MNFLSYFIIDVWNHIQNQKDLKYPSHKLCKARKISNEIIDEKIKAHEAKSNN